jgi:hypothetical protein
MSILLERLVYSTNSQLEDIAELLASTLSINMHEYQSPMIGPWYSSQDLESVMTAVRSNDSELLNELTADDKVYPDITIQLNHPDPYHGGPSYPSAGPCILLIEGSSSDLQEIEAIIKASTLHLTRVSNLTVPLPTESRSG